MKNHGGENLLSDLAVFQKPKKTWIVYCKKGVELKAEP